MSKQYRSSKPVYGDACRSPAPCSNPLKAERPIKLLYNHMSPERVAYVQVLVRLAGPAPTDGVSLALFVPAAEDEAPALVRRKASNGLLRPLGLAFLDVSLSSATAATFLLPALVVRVAVAGGEAGAKGVVSGVLALSLSAVGISGSARGSSSLPPSTGDSVSVTSSCFSSCFSSAFSSSAFIFSKT